MEREQTTIRLPAELLKQLRQEADEMGLSLNDMILIKIRKGCQSE